MKRPLSPSHHPETGVRLVEVGSCPPSQPEQRMKREKKHQSFTLCEVCNIQLNSAAQAQIHYNGKSHQKRLKQLNKGKMPAAQVSCYARNPVIAFNKLRDAQWLFVCSNIQYRSSGLCRSRGPPYPPKGARIGSTITPRLREQEDFG
ncbi:zinc finger protein 385B-like [Calypte anna]|uniref:zinc finger protein 385B-like n=1 Tax=Calypte anna TaxID=9244 RepID=UPI0011C3460D|nr:zinc finger protein 385B-like [Calypte anna]